MANSQETYHFNLEKLLPPKGWRFLIIILLAIGIFFRFTNLDKQIYWHDEAYTSLRISGYSLQEMDRSLYNGNLISPWDLQKFQRVNSEKTLKDTLQQLADLEPQLSPLYLILARFWSEWFGSSVAVIRSLSVLINLLIFPGIYWLCWELFQSPTLSWITVGLIAISPFHLLYAQEARSYSLWTVTILLSNAAFLRALRVKTTKIWVIYGMTMVLNLYSHSLSILMGIMHGIYLLGMVGFRQKKILISYCLTWLGIIIAWMPWLWVILKNLEQAHDRLSWMEETHTNRLWLLKLFLQESTGVFLDVTELLRNPHQFSHKIFLFFVFCIILLIMYSLFFIVYTTSKKSRLFILLLIGFGGLIFAFVDLIFGGIRSLSPRYLIPYYLGIHIAVTQMLYQKIISPISLQKKLGIGILVLLISSSLMSSIFISQQECSWPRKSSCDNIEISRIINEYSEPLILSDISNGINIGQLFSLSYKLNPQVRLQLVNSPSQLKIASGYRDIFLYNVSPSLREEIARSRPFQIQSVYQGKYLKLEKLVPSK